MMVHFDDLFTVTEGNILKPKVVIRINNILLTPTEYPPLESLAIGGVPLPQLTDKLVDIDIEYDVVAVFTVRSVIDDIKT